MESPCEYIVPLVSSACRKRRRKAGPVGVRASTRIGSQVSPANCKRREKGVPSWGSRGRSHGSLGRVDPQYPMLIVRGDLKGATCLP